MKKVNKFIFVFLFVSIIQAQIPPVDISYREAMFRKKAELYQQMMRCEQQITANQEDYDAVYYSLDLVPNATTQVLESTVVIAGEVVGSTLSQVELNLWDGMIISDVHISDAPAVQLAYTQQNDMLTVDLDRVYGQGEPFSLSVSYSGEPHNSGYWSFIFDYYENESMIWTISSVFGARGWWPCKDIPSDKPDSVDVRITVPNNTIAVSNGLLRETSVTDNQTTYRWHEKYPIATYLVSLCVYPYDVHYNHYIYNSGTDTMRVEFYNFPGNYEQYEPINLLVVDVLNCYSELFGAYPFADEKYAQVDFLWGGGMEHQTCTSYGTWNESLYAHEIAHQWWGDMITCDSFHHIWLNEGFASYCEALWFEYAYPPYTASEYQTMYQLYLGPGTVYVEDPENENIFDSGLSYTKGSWILHMLRHVVGDETFFEILRTYYDSPQKYGTATTDDFQAICERVSGMNLDKFFYQWMHEEYYPYYSYSWNWEQNGSVYNIDLEIRQDQIPYYFWMPVDVTVTTTSDETTFVVWDSLASQTFQLSVDSEPVDLELDRNNWILKRLEEHFADPSFDQGVLLVNGVSFDVYGQEIWDSYENRAFWGNYPISFWDCFTTTAAGYPTTLPEPIGFGKVTGDVLGQYSTVIWVGNDYGGDLGSWQLTSILSYLEAGGNVLLMTRHGQNYVDEELREYLGISWAEDPLSTINNCVSTFTGLSNMNLTGAQTYNAVFETGLASNESTLLFQETASFGTSRGLGVWHDPETGGTHRSEGGQFVFISGRPYRYDSNQLRTNIEYILGNIFHEADNQSVESNNTFVNDFRLEQNYPNPFNNSTTIRFYLPQSTEVSVKIYSIEGRLIRKLMDEQTYQIGSHSIQWDGRDEHHQLVSSGVYCVKLESKDFNKTKKMIYLK